MTTQSESGAGCDMLPTLCFACSMKTNNTKCKVEDRHKCCISGAYMWIAED